MTTKEKLSYHEFIDNLEQFYGTECYHRLGLYPIVATDGIKYFIEQCDCLWLFDEICLRLYKDLQRYGMLFVNVEVNKRHTVCITAEIDKDKPIPFKRKVHDAMELIPVGSYRFYLIDNVILLPSEY